MIKYHAGGSSVCVGDDRTTLPNFAVDRSERFEASEFLGSRYSIWKGPTDGRGLDGEGEQDIRSLSIDGEIDPNRFEVLGVDDGLSLNGETRREQLLLRAIQVDVVIAKSLYYEYDQRTLHWIGETNEVTEFECYGTTIRHPGARRYIIYFSYKPESKKWLWDFRSISVKRTLSDKALVLMLP